MIALAVRWNANRGGTADKITPEVSAEIQLGMTERQVETLLGRPADRQYHPWDIAVLLAPAPGTEPEWEKLWIGNNGTVMIVQFNAEGKVCNKALSSMAWE